MVSINLFHLLLRCSCRGQYVSYLLKCCLCRGQAHLLQAVVALLMSMSKPFLNDVVDVEVNLNFLIRC